MTLWDVTYKVADSMVIRIECEHEPMIAGTSHAM